MRQTVLLGFLVVTLGLASAGCKDKADDDRPRLPLPGLTGEVEVIQDDRGMWHIYATNLEDAYRVEGYLMARDRLLQMELMRRQTRGELSQAFGSTTLEDDIAARFEGHGRIAAQIWNLLASDEQALLRAFSEGITAHIDEVRENPDLRPRGSTLVSTDFLRDWDPVDTLSIARYMTASLSFDMRYGLNRTLQLAAYREAFGEGAPFGDALRENAFHDLYPIAPSEFVPFIDGFPNVVGGTQTGFRALLPSPAPGAPPASAPQPSRRVLEAAVAFADHQATMHERWFGDEDTRGSNSWVVSGTHTQSGYPIMSNDPHLSLTSPALFWMVHIDTKRLGGGDMNVQGLALAGTPGVLLGYNEHVAWGMTTHGYDVTDNWHETLNGDCTAVLWTDPANPGAGEIEVPFETVAEVISVGGVEQTVEFLRTPHHGFVVPGTFDCEAKEAITGRWQGMDPSNELGAILGVNQATSIEEVEAAMNRFEVGGQTLVVADRDGRIYYTSQMKLPLRTNADSYDPATQTGVSPCFVLPGDGSVEWDGYLDDVHIPHALEPASGFVATANSDPVGVTFDGNPHNGANPDSAGDNIFIGCDFADGHRTARITERLLELIDAGPLTPEQMSALQGDAQSPFGRRFTPMLLEELGRAEAHLAAPAAATEDLADALAEVDAATWTKILAMRDRLAGWEAHGYDTPAGTPNSGSEGPVEASIATSVFNVVFSYLMRLTFDDDYAAMGYGLNGRLVRTMQWAVEGNPRGLVTAWDPDLRGGQGDMVWWDDLTTVDVQESRGDRVVRAFAAAVPTLEAVFDTADMNEWRWGKVHTLRLNSLVPFAESILSIPPEGDTEYPVGFPRHGDRNVVDASNFGRFNTDRFSYSSGPQQRLVVTMTPSGPQAYNAIPGGNSMDPDSPFHSNEMDHWRINEAPPVYFEFDEVDAHAVGRFTFAP
jgi:penicillin G amidase